MLALKIIFILLFMINYELSKSKDLRSQEINDYLGILLFIGFVIIGFIEN